jgi:5-methyltetrahydrofolate--homocysteine methyltransferase
METRLASPTRDVVIGPEQPFVVIGERINPTGRSALQEELRAGDLSRVEADARAQVEAGAAVLDVNAGIPGVDEPVLLTRMVRLIASATDVPLSIDSSTPAALEAALAAYDGKALVNSTTGESSHLERVLPLVAKHGAAVIGMAHDERGISMDPQVRLEAARTIVERAADHGVPRKDVLIDPLAMTVAADPAAGAVFLEAAGRIRDELGVNLTCGASNVSFGLPGRHTVTATFLALAMPAGLTCAIANPIDPEVRRAILAADLVLGRDGYAVRWIANHRAERAAANAGG